MPTLSTAKNFMARDIGRGSKTYYECVCKVIEHAGWRFDPRTCRWETGDGISISAGVVIDAPSYVLKFWFGTQALALIERAWEEVGFMAAKSFLVCVQEESPVSHRELYVVR